MPQHVFHRPTGDLDALEHDASLRQACAECHTMFRKRLRSAAGEALR